MFSTKIEVSLPKAEPGSWSKLDFPRSNQVESTNDQQEKITDAKIAAMTNIGKKSSNIPLREEKDFHKPGSDSEDLSDVDLDDIEITKGASIAELGDYKLMEDA